MKVLVSGAGIAGLSLAYWLYHFGIKVTLIEKSPDIRTEGYMIDFGGTGWDLADKMGIIPAIRQKAHQTDLIRYVGDHGDTKAKLTLTQLFKTAGVEDKFAVLNRRDLVALLYDQVKSDVQICFDTSISSICQNQDAVTGTFNNGEQASYDLLVGADGIHSNIRRIAFGDESTFANYLGYHFAIFLIPALDHTLENAYSIHLEPGIQVGVYPQNDGQWMVFVIYRADDPTLPAPAGRKAELQRRLHGAGWITRQLLDALNDDDYIFYDTITQIVVPRWYNNHVVLIGDAAHCPTLISGQGASMAMAGAYYLSQALHHHAGLPDALAEYDTRLRPHIERIQRKARNFAPNFVPSGTLRIGLVHTMLRLVDLPLINTLIGKQFSVNSILDSA